jgi:hypothetical protein
VILVRIDELRRAADPKDPLDQPNVVEPVPTVPGN